MQKKSSFFYYFLVVFEAQLQIDVIRIINLYVSIFNFNCFCMFVMFVYSSCPFLSFEVPFSFKFCLHEDV